MLCCERCTWCWFGPFSLMLFYMTFSDSFLPMSFGYLIAYSIITDMWLLIIQLSNRLPFFDMTSWCNNRKKKKDQIFYRCNSRVILNIWGFCCVQKNNYPCPRKRNCTDHDCKLDLLISLKLFFLDWVSWCLTTRKTNCRKQVNSAVNSWR